MKLTILGSSGTYAAQGGACTGYLIDAGGVKVWLDCGPGTLGRLGDFVKLEELEAVVVSHEHPDHCLELPVLYNALRYHRSRALLKVFGTADTKQLIARIVGRPLEAVFDWRIVTSGDEAKIGDGRWSFDRTDHPPETLAVKVEADGRSLVFSSDTGPGWTGKSFAEEVDVLLCESTFAHDEDDADDRAGRYDEDDRVNRDVEDDRAGRADRTDGDDRVDGNDEDDEDDVDDRVGRADRTEAARASRADRSHTRSSLPAGRPTGTKHLLAAEAGNIARNCGVGRLMLTHLAPGSDRDAHLERAQSRFGGETEVVSDCTTYTV